jgi:hypothetical protein
MTRLLFDHAIAGPVIGQEDLFQAGLDASQVPDLEPGRSFHQRIQAAHDGAAQDTVVDGQVAHARQVGEGLGFNRPAEVDLETAQGAFFERRDRLDRQQSAFADDPDSVAQVLYLGQLMG